MGNHEKDDNMIKMMQKTGSMMKDNENAEKH